MTVAVRRTVVVAVDGTADGERAIRYGVGLASREHLDLRLVHVPHAYETFSPMLPYLPATTVREIGETVLRDATKHAEEAGLESRRITTVLADGPRTAALLGTLHEARCVVLGTRASAVQHLLSGATSMSVAKHASVPVHCVPRSWSVDRSPTGHVVVGVDGSAADRDVLAEAFTEASHRQAVLEIVHAWRPVPPYDAAVAGRVIRDDWEQGARKALSGVVDEVAAARPGVGWSLRLDYQRVPVALHEAALDADLLVLGRHGHDATLGRRIGSNTRTLLHSATCPVVVVPVPCDET